MKAAVLSFSKKGSLLANKIEDILGRNNISALSYTMEKFATGNMEIIKGGITAFTVTIFNEVDLLVFIGATGIAVRAIAPYIKSKVTDPARICLDEQGKFAISLLSGHIGGGNMLTDMIAKALDAVAVITTATVINGRF